MTLALPTFSPGAGALQSASLPAADVPGLYVHIPFCFHKCHYCDFYSITRQTPERMEHFVDLMLSEAELWTATAGPNVAPRTIFFGGGTPTLLPIAAMERLLAGLRQRFDFSHLIEWTVEANPATVTADYCAMLASAGVNRLSFGAQSFNTEHLKTLERHHDPDDVPRSIELARAAGFRRLNVDLIYAIPGQTLDDWAASLDAALALDTPHISCYALTYEPNTPMAVKKRLGRIAAAPESLELEMMHYTRQRLIAAGRHPYEISNYAVRGEECRHNLLYWTGENYIGLGPSAASHVAGHRWKNRPHLGEWEAASERQQLPAIEFERLTPEQRAGELAMLLLRLESGLQFEAFLAKTGFDARELYAKTIEQLAAAGLLQVTPDSLTLTTKGLNVADAIAAEFLAAP
ncbi:MAG TPA: radical SAM family heme chaperone HemW [Tepidisphaeraceae bacterium]|jgi:oxygen-independent coproporphyrinogen-3 oxidase